MLNLGPREDWFVRVTRFEASTPFEYRTEFYRLTDRVVPSLRYHHYANSNSWSSGPEDRFRYGRLGFGFQRPRPGVRSSGANRGVNSDAAADHLGRGTPTGSAASRSRRSMAVSCTASIWDGPRTLRPCRSNRRRLSSGGPQSYNFWSDWTVVVPGKKPPNLRAELARGRGREGPGSGSQPAAGTGISLGSSSGETVPEGIEGPRCDSNRQAAGAGF